MAMAGAGGLMAAQASEWFIRSVEDHSERVPDFLETACVQAGMFHANTMKIQLLIRRFAGLFVLTSLVLAHYHNAHWLWVTAFVGANLLQSSFTNFCPLEIILKKCGVGAEGPACCSRPPE